MKRTNYQYDYMFDQSANDLIMGVVAGSTWSKDPKRLLFTLSRYKFVAKMFEGYGRVLEVGCGDAWASRIVAQQVSKLVCTDIDERFIKDAAKYSDGRWPVELKVANILTDHLNDSFDGVFLLDVFEHIEPEGEIAFIHSLHRLLKPSGSLIVGVPTSRSQELIPIDKRDPGHVNCKSGDLLRKTFLPFFANVFLFSMNDEVVHTGHPDMAHYALVLCCGPREL